MELIWRDPKTDKPEGNRRILLWLTSGEIVSGEYKPNDKLIPYYDADLWSNFHQNGCFGEGQITAWAEFPDDPGIRKEEQNE